MKIPSRSWKSEQGNSMVEFSLVAVVFVMLLLGVVEMGRLILVYTTMAQAAKAGARYAIVHGNFRTGAGATGPSGPADYSQIQTVVQNFAGAGGIRLLANATTVTYTNDTMTCIYPPNGPGCSVQVKVTYPFAPLLGYFNPMLSMTLSSTSKGVITY
jgi:Flp pilus assembly protein TadG